MPRLPAITEARRDRGRLVKRREHAAKFIADNPRSDLYTQRDLDYLDGKIKDADERIDRLMQRETA